MLGTDEAHEPLAAAYRDAAERLRSSLEDAVRRAQAAMRSTAGWQAAAKAAGAQSVLEVATSECDAIVTRLVEAHVDSGEQNATRAAELVRDGFLSGLTAPGLSFFQSSGPESAALAVVASRHAADFESSRDRLAAEVPERFQAALESRKPHASPRFEPLSMTQRLRQSRTVFAFLVLSTVLSIAGVSWMDVLRRACALL